MIQMTPQQLIQSLAADPSVVYHSEVLVNRDCLRTTVISFSRYLDDGTVQVGELHLNEVCKAKQ